MQIVALADLDGNVTQMLAQQVRGADGQYHDIE